MDAARKSTQMVKLVSILSFSQRPSVCFDQKNTDSNSRISHPNNNNVRYFSTSGGSKSFKLIEVGKEVKVSGNYDTGQMILHRIFEYRGVVLFPWKTQIFDRTPPTKNKTELGTTTSEMKKKSKKVNPKGQPVIYYAVLADAKDIEKIKNRDQSDYVKFLGSPEENPQTLYGIRGLDYVCHDDIFPYITGDEVPIKNELFDKFLVRDGRYTDRMVFEALPLLNRWKEREIMPKLKCSSVFTETSENNLKVTVIPFYLGVDRSHNYWWRYCIRIENFSEKTVQLRERNWKIHSIPGTIY